MRFYHKFHVSEDATKQIHSPEDVFNSVRDLAYADQESFWIIGYSNTNIEIFRECVFLGGLNTCTVDLRILFKRLILHDCISFIILHNHPADSSKPSEEDITVTKRICLAGETIGIKLLDSMIICENQFFSFKSKGLIV